MTRECARCGASFAARTNARFCATCRPVAYREHKAAYQRARRAQGISTGRDYALLRNYGVTEEWYHEQIAANEQKCPICMTWPEQWHVDHDHETGKVRGVICNRCNWMLGHSGDSPDVLRSAAAYLEARR